MSVSVLPFDDLRALFDKLPGPDEEAAATVRSRNQGLFGKEAGAGDFEPLLEWMAAWSGLTPKVHRPLLAIFAGTHGATSDELRSDAVRRVERVQAGDAPVNRICGEFGLGLKLFDLAMQAPVGDISLDAAIDEKSAAGTFGYGMEAVAGGIDLLCLSDCGIGAATSTAAIFAAVHGGTVAEWCPDQADERKAERALELHARHGTDRLELLRRLGGRESWAIAGAIVAARVQHVPVVLDGFAALAAACAFRGIDAGSISHCVIAGRPGSGPYARMADALGIPAVMNRTTGGTEGEGAALAAGLLKGMAAIHADG